MQKGVKKPAVIFFGKQGEKSVIFNLIGINQGPVKVKNDYLDCHDMYLKRLCNCSDPIGNSCFPFLAQKPGNSFILVKRIIIIMSCRNLFENGPIQSTEFVPLAGGN